MWSSSYRQDTTTAETGTVSSTYTDQASSRVIVTYARRVDTLDVTDLRDYVAEAEAALSNAQIIDDGTQDIIKRVEDALNDV